MDGSSRTDKFERQMFTHKEGAFMYHTLMEINTAVWRAFESDEKIEPTEILDLLNPWAGKM